ncbi:DUF4058 family protein [Nodosilinea sp. LEGE 07088]|nr:DUF4058 family protein [Nodosilinea sp. LEGE 07088]
MDPYLEHPEIWPGVHLLLIAALAEALGPQLRPKYSVSVEVRMYETSGDQALLVGIPDGAIQRAKPQAEMQPTTVAVAPPPQPIQVRVPMPLTVRQGYLEVREVATREVVTAVELLSPINKRSGRGRQPYENKREQVLSSATHFVEIDLLRAYEPMAIFGAAGQSDYCILVSRSEQRPIASLYAFSVQNTIPAFALPLREDDLEPTVDLQGLLNEIYDKFGYDLKLDYRAEPVSPLANAVAAWGNELLKQAGF